MIQVVLFQLKKNGSIINIDLDDLDLSQASQKNTGNELEDDIHILENHEVLISDIQKKPLNPVPLPLQPLLLVRTGIA